MQLNKHHRDHSIGFNITPMIDVVFLLIIFFMTVSQISRINAQAVQLPQAQAREDASPPIPLTLTIDREGRLIFGGEYQSAEEFLSHVGNQLAASGGDPASVRMLIRCDHRAASRHVNELIPRLVTLGITQIRTAVTDE